MTGKQPNPVIRPRYEHSHSTVEEWLNYSHARGRLVEQLYKRDGWQQLIRLSAPKNELREKLLALSSEEIARLIIMLDHS